MNKKMFFLLTTRLILITLLLIYSYVGKTQTIGPSVNASSIIPGNSSTNVNPNTGIFNYTIPLIVNETNGVPLTIGIGYTAKGIKVEEKPSAVGLGWGLMGLGVIHRTVRGKYDEELLNGLLWDTIPLSTTAFNNRKSAVNQKIKDGENDIFSINYNNISADFFLINENNKFQVQFLEQKDLKIEVENVGQNITGFVVIDGSGNKYFFREIERIITYIREGKSDNSQSVYYDLPSAWYLTEVNYYNGHSVKFNYLNDVVSEVSASKEERIDYYGKSWENVGQDSSILNDIATITEAMANVSESHQQIVDRINKSLNYYNQVKSSFQAIYETVETQRKELTVKDLEKGTLNDVIGDNDMQDMKSWIQESDLKSIGGGIEFQFAQAQNTFHQYESYQSQLQYLYFTLMQTKTYETYRNSYSGEAVFRSIKRIRSIEHPGGVVEFKYLNGFFSGNKFLFLKDITALDKKFDKLKGVQFIYDTITNPDLSITTNGLLKSVEIFGKVDTNGVKYGFEYFNEAFLNSAATINDQDYWGFYNGKGNTTLLSIDPHYTTVTSEGTISTFRSSLGGVEDFSVPNINISVPSPGNREPVLEHAIARTLKTIKEPLGKKILLDYELNSYAAQLVTAVNINVGGLRIKSIKQTSGNSDTLKVSYRYNFQSDNTVPNYKSSGQLTTWKKKKFHLGVNYGNGYFTDQVLSSSPFNFTPDVKEMGNEGVIYHYVEEIIEGRGKTGYKYFGFADDIYSTIYDIQPYWLENLLLAKIHFNEANQIVSIEKNNYLLHQKDIPFNNLLQANSYEYDFLKSFHFTADSSRSFSKVKQQIRPYPVNFDSLTLYRDVSQASGPYVLVYDDPNPNDKVYYNDYLNNYLPNIEPRLNNTSELFTYKVNYGGKVLLKEISKLTVQPLANEIVNNSGLFIEEPYRYLSFLSDTLSGLLKEKTVFYYDNIKHNYPTSSESYLSGNKRSIQKNKYAYDYSSGTDNIIDSLVKQGRGNEQIEKQSWVYDPLISEWKFGGGAITKFGQVENGNKKLFVPIEMYNSNLVKPISPGTNGWLETIVQKAPFNNVFHEGQNIYKKEVDNKWQVNPGGFLVYRGAIGKNGKTKEANVSDISVDYPVANFKHSVPEDVIAIDMGWLNDIKAKNSGYRQTLLLIDTTYNFHYGATPPPGSDEYDYAAYGEFFIRRFEQMQLSEQPGWDYCSQDTLFNSAKRLIYCLAKRKVHSAYLDDIYRFRNGYENSFLGATITPNIDTLSDYCNPYFDVKSLLGFLYKSSGYLQYELIYNQTISEYPVIKTEQFNGIHQYSLDLSNYKLTEKKVRVMGIGWSTLQFKLHFTGGTVTTHSVTPTTSIGNIQIGYIDIQAVANWQNVQTLSFTIGGSSGNQVSENLTLSPEDSDFELYHRTVDNKIKYVYNQNGDRINYTYDDWDRINYITDKNGHILKKFEYAIQKKQTPYTLYANEEKSRSLVKNNCGVDSVGNSYTYTVPEGRYTATSLAEANILAEADLDANAQNFANTYGTCSAATTSTIYARLELDDFYEDIETASGPWAYELLTQYANLYLRFYSDAACTIPVTLSSSLTYSLKHSYTTHTRNGTVYNNGDYEMGNNTVQSGVSSYLVGDFGWIFYRHLDYDEYDSNIIIGELLESNTFSITVATGSATTFTPVPIITRYNKHPEYYY
jgi:hypothetical protein